MKKAIIIICILTTFFACSQQNHSDKKEQYKNNKEYALTLNKRHTVINVEKTKNNHYRSYVLASDENYNQNYYFLEFDSKGDFLDSIPILFDAPLMDYIEHGNHYYVLSADMETEGHYQKNILYKFDKKWKQIWSVNSNHLRRDDGSATFTITPENEILLISNKFILNTDKEGIVIDRYNLDGEFLSEKFLIEKKYSDPISIVESMDNNYFLTGMKYDEKTEVNFLWLLKINAQGDTIWTKSYPDFYPKETIVSSNGDLVFYGSNYAEIEEQKNNYHYLKIIVLDKEGNKKWGKEIKQNYYEDPLQLIENKKGNYLFLSKITPVKDKGDFTYLFEMNKEGNLEMEKKIENIGEIKCLFETENQQVLLGTKKVNAQGIPPYDKIQVVKLVKE